MGFWQDNILFNISNKDSSFKKKQKITSWFSNGHQGHYHHHQQMSTEFLEYVGSCVSLREDKRLHDGIEFSSYKCLHHIISSLRTVYLHLLWIFGWVYSCIYLKQNLLGLGVNIGPNFRPQSYFGVGFMHNKTNVDGWEKKV